MHYDKGFMEIGTVQLMVVLLLLLFFFFFFFFFLGGGGLLWLALQKIQSKLSCILALV